MSNLQITAAVVSALEQLQIDYMLVGAYSSNAYGISRATHDADFVVDVKPGQLRALVELLGAEYSLNPQMQMENITGSIRNVVTHVPSGFQIELFRLNTRDEHHRERFRRRRRQLLVEIQQEAWIPSAEDVLIQKLRWQRFKDLDDALGILGVSGSFLDFEYVRLWTRLHGTDSLLDTLLRNAAIVPESDSGTTPS